MVWRVGFGFQFSVRTSIFVFLFRSRFDRVFSYILFRFQFRITCIKCTALHRSVPHSGAYTGLHATVLLYTITIIRYIVYHATLNGMKPRFTGMNDNDVMIASHRSSGVREEHGEGGHRHGRGGAHDQGPCNLRTRVERYGGPVPHDRALHGRDQGRSMLLVLFFLGHCWSIAVFILYIDTFISLFFVPLVYLFFHPFFRFSFFFSFIYLLSFGARPFLEEHRIAAAQWYGEHSSNDALHIEYTHICLLYTSDAADE